MKKEKLFRDMIVISVFLFSICSNFVLAQSQIQMKITAPVDTIYQYRWEGAGFEKNSSDPNIRVGISTKESTPAQGWGWNNDPNAFNFLVKYYAFDAIVVGQNWNTELDQAHNAGFTHICAGISAEHPYQGLIVDIKPQAASSYISDFYTDEPFTNFGVSGIDSTIHMKQIIQNHFGGKSLTVGETITSKANLFRDIANYLTMTSYDEYSTYMDEIYYLRIPLGPDQRTNWDQWNTKFGSKFNMLWMSASSDNNGEYQLLFPKAVQLGISKVFLWAGDPLAGNATLWYAINDFCYRAYQNGYLYGRQRQYKDIYVYNGQSYVYANTVPTSQVRKIDKYGNQVGSVYNMDLITGLPWDYPVGLMSPSIVGTGNTAQIKLSALQENDIKYELQENYPNPFNPTTTINYTLPEEGFVTLKVYDVLGREVVALVNEVKSAGHYKVDFDAGKLTSGVYIYTLRVNNFIQSKKMLLAK